MPYADPEREREYHRARGRTLERREQIYAYQRRRYATDPEYREKMKAAARQMPKEIDNAHKAVRRALRRGDLVRPETCEECGRYPMRGKIQAAHIDYAKPLLIRWLCGSCHYRFDHDDPKGAHLRG